MAGFATVTFAALVLERAFAFALAVLMSSAFGTSRSLDMYLLAVAGPTVVGLLVGDLVYSLLLPKLTSQRPLGDGADPRWAVLLSAVMLIGAMNLLYVIGWGVAVWSFGSPEEAGGLIRLGVLTSSLILLGGVGALGATLLVAERRYVLAVARFPLTSLVTVVCFVTIQQFTSAIEGLAQSVVVGSLVSAVVVVVAAGRRLGPVSLAGVSAWWSYGWLGRTPIAQLAAGLTAQAAVVIERLVGIGLGAGVVSSLNYGRTLVSPPLLIGQSIATAAYPRFVGRVGAADRHRELGRMIGIVVFLLLPLSAILVVLADPLVRLLFKRGSFDESAAVQAATAAVIFAFSLVPIAVCAIATRFLYAEQDATKVAALSTAALIAYGALALLLGRSIGYPGLAVSSTASYALLAISLLVAIRDDVYRGWGHVPFAALARSVSGVVLMTVVMLLIRGVDGSTSQAEPAATALVAALGSVTYCLAMLTMRSPELVQVAAALRRVAGSAAPLARRP